MIQAHLVQLESTGWAAWEPYLDRLDPWRREAIARMKSDAARTRSLCAHLLVRWLTCGALGVSNGGLAMAAGGNGKPYFPDHPDFHFSLSHTDGAVAAVVADQPVGIDLERERAVNPRIARRFFTPDEARHVFGQQEDQSLRLLEIWTRKEACVKWQGGVLAASLGRLDVLSPQWSRRLHTHRRDGYIISVCWEGAEPVPCPQVLSQKELEESIRELERVC